MDVGELPRFRLDLDVQFRIAEESDLEKLEWYGQYTHFRNLFRLTYEGQLRGERLMLLADTNGFPVGQVFILLNQRINLWQSVLNRSGNPPQQRGYLYALRVMDHLQGQGIGTRLILEAERLMVENGSSWSTISVAKDNPRAMQLYSRLDYDVYMEDEGRWSYVDHTGKTINVHEPCYMMEKRL
ncbi:MAG: GNAT family N-acetyltransferase [Chloroflexi bacterium]|nr:GNAT family N-acetyltransferase [Chloroflexota bacterium]